MHYTRLSLKPCTYCTTYGLQTLKQINALQSVAAMLDSLSRQRELEISAEHMDKVYLHAYVKLFPYFVFIASKSACR